LVSVAVVGDRAKKRRQSNPSHRQHRKLDLGGEEGRDRRR
jgi:hypothetical protein